MKLKQLLILVLIALCGNILLTFSQLPTYLGFSRSETQEFQSLLQEKKLVINQLKEEILVIESNLLECELSNALLDDKAENFETLLDEKYLELDRLAEKMRKMKDAR
ncbi:MAG: hypothetical protein AAF696_16215 [Bacteroidota bacterium]